MDVNKAQDIAIVGMAGLFPKAPDIAAYWHNILEKVDAIEDAPPEWGSEWFLDPTSEDITRIYTQRGGFLKDLSRFDPTVFNIMPASVEGGEPDQFHALLLAKKALEDAGLKDDSHPPESTGIILGHGIHAHRANTNGIQLGIVIDQTLSLLKGLFPHISPAQMASIRALLRSKLPSLNVDAAPGLVPNVMTGRIANRLNFMGPNYIIDAACASSLIAVECAMKELVSGRADLMLAGGINTSTSPLVYMVFCALNALSRRPHVRPFDRLADGTLLGEGGGILVLKRLKEAVRDGDRIYAVLKSVGQSSDGRAKGVMAPRLEGEVLAMQRAYRQGIDPHTIGLLEAHGTGIPLGDQTEIQAIRRVWGERGRSLPHIALGSVKSMIGHCIPAAGIASLIKVALALHHEVLPPTLCDEPDDQLPWDKLPCYLNTEARPWIHGHAHPRRAGISAFGFGGVNAHAVLEEHKEDDVLSALIPARWRRGSELLLFAASNREELRRQIDAIERGTDIAPLAARCWSRLSHGPLRLAVVVETQEVLAHKLNLVSSYLKDPDVHQLKHRKGIYLRERPKPGRIAFLFPGENAQYSNMLRRLAIHIPLVRQWFDFLDELFAQDRDIAPSEAVFPPPTGLDQETRQKLEARLAGMELGSESAFAADLALFHLLQALGVKPDAMLGHSTGENAALVTSGKLVMDKPALGNYIRRMNRLYRRLESDQAIPYGAMFSIGAIHVKDISSILEQHPDVYLTMDNCPNQFILFGNPKTMEDLMPRLKEMGAITVRLPLSRAYHTSHMQPMAQAFRRLFQDIDYRDNAVTLYSCATASPFPKVPEQALETAIYQYTHCVRFREALLNLYAEGIRIFIEVGPNTHLTGFVRDTLRGRPHTAIPCHDPRRDDLEQIHHLLGQLYVEGVDVHLSPWFENVFKAPKPSGRHLPTHLPFIHLDEKETERLRGMFLPAHRSNDVMMKHFELMEDFLAQEERVTLAWLSSRKRRS